MVSFVHVEMFVTSSGVESLARDHVSSIVGQQILVTTLVLPSPVSRYTLPSPLVSSTAGVVEWTPIFETTDHQDYSQQ